MYLVVDCETNGLPRDFQAPIEDVENWPRAVQVAWGLYDHQHRLTASASRLVQPKGWVIPADTARLHGITTQRALAEGFPIENVLHELNQAAAGASHYIAHNASFDGSVIAAEFLRLGWAPPFVPRTMICTMEESTDYCQLPGGPRGYKWPKLDELYYILFGRVFGGAHDAGVDAAICACCFFELKNRGVVVCR